MEIEYRLKLGQNEFKLTFNAEDEKEVFQKLSFFNTLPKTGPNGEDDLRLSFSKNKDGNEFYSVVSDQAKMEYKYGQRKSDKGLFPKGWEPLYNPEQSYQESQEAAAPVIPSRPAVKSTPITPVAPRQAKPVVVQEAAKPINSSVESTLAKFGIPSKK